MIAGVPTLGIRFDVGKIDNGDYGGLCWKVFWRAVDVGTIRGATLFEGDTYGGNVYCIAVQIADAAVFDEIQAALERSEDFKKIAASPKFAQGSAVTQEPLIDTGRVDVSGQLVGGISSGPALKAVLQEKRDAPEPIRGAGLGDSPAMDDVDRTLEGHTGDVLSVAITPDGTRVVSGSGDQTIRVWNLQSGCLERTFEGQARRVVAVAITPDGTRVISGSWFDDNVVRVWDLASGRLERILVGHTQMVAAVAVTPDGARVVSGSFDNTVRVWDLASGRLERTLTGHTHAECSVAVTPDGTRIVSGSFDNTVRVWDLASGRLEGTLEGHTAEVHAVAITRDGARIVSGSGDKTVRVWDLASGRLEGTLEGHTAEVLAVAITPDGKRIVSAGNDNLRVWVAPARLVAPAPTPALVAPGWIPTHLVPPGGMAAWDAPDPSRPPMAHLPERIELVVEAGVGAWAQVRAVNGWRGWVDGRLLYRR